MTHYPITIDLICKLKEIYMINRIGKGDSWIDCSPKFLFNKSKEEFKEIQHSKDVECMQVEILGCILVLSMLYNRINPYHGMNMSIQNVIGDLE